ncbi:hypothetical protein [Candidatus Enterovibrio escicola]|uniref:Uncharacterized protein n=1 Tax=Candidatus Enterovibrio escicola TaxID=1927127 RepID=A0A2A5T6R9_9GAMM|nr:hypothetical protein [Candidatus Enterovibrio escacola]PCS23863.1 hypothetical protein BTN49_0834 [Candidatus Enterovibrio escacola]
MGNYEFKLTKLEMKSRFFREQKPYQLTTIGSKQIEEHTMLWVGEPN